MASPPIVLGLDSATRCGWALVQGERLIEHGVVSPATDRRRQDTLAAYVCSKTRPDLVVIEDNWLGDNPSTVKVLARMVGAWEMAFAIRGVETELMIPAEWRQVLRGIVCKKPMSDDWKRAAIAWVKATYGVTAGEDAAEAIAMSTFVSRRESYAAKVRRVTGALPRTAV
jgi:Holliday junction resolvasome RuvABC endonuclease subunit